ncbi:hypothetical protein [Serratia marcescens]|uniref:hypothetical protein n=3 Tax=Serratia marcescens TaxID=615 RepID=UPI0011B4240A|nr:hypothetical protein [Serratia marcescens]MCK1091041.1 hypothetical protein [Serratia marcescens]
MMNVPVILQLHWGRRCYPIATVNYQDRMMCKSLYLVVGIMALSGCAGQNDDYSSAHKNAAHQEAGKEWKAFVAPLSVKTQSPGEREMKRAARHD